MLYPLEIAGTFLALIQFQGIEWLSVWNEKWKPSFIPLLLSFCVDSVGEVKLLNVHLRAVFVLDRCVLHLLGHIVENRRYHVFQLVSTDVDKCHQKSQQDHGEYDQQEDQSGRVTADMGLRLEMRRLRVAVVRLILCGV